MSPLSRSVLFVETELEKIQAEKDRSSITGKTYYCEVMKQKFSNYTTFMNRLTTNKYKKMLEDSLKLKKKQEGEMQEKKVEEKPKSKTSQEGPNICLFTNKEYESVEK